MALETKPAWVAELTKRLAEPYTADELARLREWTDRVKRINGNQVWPPGTFERLLTLAQAEDSARGD
jgi:hypothetical protein